MSKHKTLPTIGTLVVDDLGLKVAGEANLMHIVHAIEKVWKVKINRLGNKFVGIDLEWDYNPLNPSLRKSSNVATQDGLKRFYPGEVLKGADAPSIFRFPIGRDGKPLPPPPPPPFPRKHSSYNSLQEPTTIREGPPARTSCTRSTRSPSRSQHQTQTRLEVLIIWQIT